MTRLQAGLLALLSCFAALEGLGLYLLDASEGVSVFASSKNAQPDRHYYVDRYQLVPSGSSILVAVLS
jgi:hypothetical protein